MSAASDTPSHLSHRRGGRGEPLVLLHGLGSTMRVWREVTPALEQRHDVLALDLPGFGDSPPLPHRTRYTVPALVDAVEHALDAEGLDTVHAVGNSLGGWLALEMARRGRARTVVALSPAGAWTAREVAYARAVLRVIRATTERLEPHAELVTRTAAGRAAALSSVASRPWRITPEDAAHAIRAAARAPGFLETLEWTTSHRIADPAAVRAPTRVAWGTSDRLLLPRQGPRLVRVLPAGELLRLPGLGHIPTWDDPNRVAAAILDFTSRPRGRSSGG